MVLKAENVLATFSLASLYLWMIHGVLMRWTVHFSLKRKQERESRKEGLMISAAAPELGPTPCPAPILIYCRSDESSIGASYVYSQALTMAKKNNGSQPGGGDQKKQVSLDSQMLATLKTSHPFP